MLHTPGPWKVEGRSKIDDSVVITSQAGWTAAAYDFNRYDRDAEVEANARLIAAAPDLLAACEAALDYCIHPNKRAVFDVENELRRVIAKARGGPAD